MNIIFLIRSLNLGGSERQLFLLAKGLMGRGHTIEVVTFYPNGDLEREFRQSGIAVKSLKKEGRWDILPFARKLIHYAKRSPPDVLYSFLVDANIFTLFIKIFSPGIKIVWGIRASNMDFSLYDKTARMNFFMSCLLSRLVPNSIIANSQAGLEFHCREGYPKKKLRVIFNGINTDYFFPSSTDRVNLRKSLGILKDQILVGLVGRVDPIKDHETFLRAAKIAGEKNPKLRFICVGGKPTFFLKKLTYESGLASKVIWLGQQEKMPVVFNALDMLVSTSISEGFSNVIAEAMACGVPCVATDVGDSGFILGSLGEIVPPKDPNKLSEAILQRLKKESNSELIRNRIVENFSIKKMIQNTESILLAFSEKCNPIPGGSCKNDSY